MVVLEWVSAKSGLLSEQRLLPRAVETLNSRAARNPRDETEASCLPKRVAK